MMTYIHPVVVAPSEQYSPVQTLVDSRRVQWYPVDLGLGGSVVAGTQTNQSRRRRQKPAVVGWFARK